jgi:hypothetical protein
VQANGAPKTGDHYDPKTERVVEVEARPNGDFSLGGAAFGLTSSLAGTSALNTMDQKSGKGSFNQFANEWSNAPQNTGTNAGLYTRTRAGAEFVEGVTPDGSAANRAARLARAVGEHGESAEKVFGPAARRAAYRYRGTEKKPDEEVVRQFNLVRDRAGRPSQLPADNRSAIRAAQTRALNRALEDKAIEAQKTGAQVDRNAMKLTQQERVDIMNRVIQEHAGTLAKPDPNSPVARNAGREVLATYLTDPAQNPNVPTKQLYALQLASGVTPPSEGFVIDKDGKVVTQAIGYGDDHYLPFNLKHLAKLRGGEYIRTRSVGGPTTEDIYTGLMTGAKRITVVSRSGTFTMDFEQDFKGKRRYNDKAARMVSRYGQLLDRVQSEQIDRDQQVSPEVRAFLRAEVEKETDGYGLNRKEKREALNQKVLEYKAELEMTEGDEQEFNEFFRSVTADLPEGQQKALRAQMVNDWRSQNEFKFKLNGQGYADAMRALQEQFPYYFKFDYQPRKEMGRIETEKDKGYVEPGRIRPTGATAGYYGTSANKGKTMSASQTQYQRGKYGNDGRKEAPEETSQTPEAKAASGFTALGNRPVDAVAERVQERKDENVYRDAAVALRKAIEPSDELINQQPILGLSNEEFADRMNTPEGRVEWEKFINGPQNRGIQTQARDKYRAFVVAAAQVDRQKYSVAASGTLGDKPFKFDGAPYSKSAKPQMIEAELQKHTRIPGLSGKRLDEMSDSEYKKELGLLVDLKTEAKSIQETTGTAGEALLAAMGIDDHKAAHQLVRGGPEAIQNQIESLHRVRALRANQARLPKALAQQGSSAGSSPQNPLHYGTQLSRGGATDAQNRDKIKAALAQIKDAKTFAEQTYDDATLDKLAILQTNLEDLLQGSSVITEDMIAGANEEYRKHVDMNGFL